VQIHLKLNRNTDDSSATECSASFARISSELASPNLLYASPISSVDASEQLLRLGSHKESGGPRHLQSDLERTKTDVTAIVNEAERTVYVKGLVGTCAARAFLSIALRVRE
jgi:hypothetical protein